MWVQRVGAAPCWGRSTVLLCVSAVQNGGFFGYEAINLQRSDWHTKVWEQFDRGTGVTLHKKTKPTFPP